MCLYLAHVNINFAFINSKYNNDQYEKEIF